MSFSRRRITLNNGGAVNNLNYSSDIAKLWLEVVTSFKFRGILEKRVSTANKCTGRGFKVYCRVFTFSIYGSRASSRGYIGRRLGF